MTRRQYAGSAIQTTTTTAVSASGATSIVLASASGWPDGTTGPFSIVVDAGSASEEKMLVTSRSGLTLNVTSGNRGYDGTTATTHAIGAPIWPTITAVDFDEANAHVNDASKHLSPGGVVASNLAANSVTTGAIADGAVTAAKIPDASITAAKLAANAVLLANMADASVGTAELVDAAVTTIKVADSAVTTAKIADGSLTTAKIADNAVTAAKAAASPQLDAARSNVGVTGATVSSITWDTEPNDPNGMISAPSSTITIPSGGAGKWAIDVAVTSPTSVLIGVYVAVSAGNNERMGEMTIGGSSPIGHFPVIRQLVAGDTLVFKWAPATTQTISATLTMVRISK